MIEIGKELSENRILNLFSIKIKDSFSNNYNEDLMTKYLLNNYAVIIYENKFQSVLKLFNQENLLDYIKKNNFYNYKIIGFDTKKEHQLFFELKDKFVDIDLAERFIKYECLNNFFNNISLLNKNLKAVINPDITEKKFKVRKVTFVEGKLNLHIDNSEYSVYEIENGIEVEYGEKKCFISGTDIFFINKYMFEN